MISAVFCGHLRNAEIKIAEYYMLEKQFVAFCNTNNIFRRQDIQTAENKCLFFLVQKPQKFNTAEITGYTVLNTSSM